MQKYQCGDKIIFKKCKPPVFCVPRCKEEWSAWHGGCQSDSGVNYCSDCCDLKQKRTLKMIDGWGMRGGTPPVERRDSCLNKDYFWGYTKKMKKPTYIQGDCIDTLYRFAPFFPVGRGEFSSFLYLSIFLSLSFYLYLSFYLSIYLSIYLSPFAHPVDGLANSNKTGSHTPCMLA